MKQLYLKLDLSQPGRVQLSLPWPRFQEMVSEAQHRIKDRSPQELEYSTLLLNWMFEKIDETETKQTTATSTDPAAASADFSGLTFLAPRLHRHVTDFNIDDIPELPNANWPEFFSVLALALLQTAARAHAGRADMDEETLGLYGRTMATFDRQPFGAYGTDCLMAAAEALVYADIHAEATPVAAQMVKQTISLRGQAAAIARHAGVNALKDEFLSSCQQNKPKSVREAARVFCETHRERIKALHMSVENAPRTLADHVYGIRKVDKPAE